MPLVDPSKYQLQPPRKCMICGDLTYWVKNNEPCCQTCIQRLEHGVPEANIKRWTSEVSSSKWSHETLLVTSTPEYKVIVDSRDNIKALLLLYLVDLIAMSTGLPTMLVLSILRRELFDMEPQGGTNGKRESNN